MIFILFYVFIMIAPSSCLILCLTELCYVFQSFGFCKLKGFSCLIEFMQILPSPTTGSFPFHAFNWKSNSNNNHRGIKEEKKNYSDFSFQPQTRPPLSSATNFQSQTNTVPTVNSYFSVLWFFFFYIYVVIVIYI